MVAAAPPAHSGGIAGAEPGNLSGADTPAPDIFRALKDQIGLTLESKKGPVELIVINHIDKIPTEN
jgi:uncharacterized protein (TIGR03435 family)